MKWAMYIDGFNFYYGIRERPEVTPLYLGWCDFGALGRDIIGDRGTLVKIKYFTAPVGEFGKEGGPLGAESVRQGVWMRAIRTIPLIEIVEGVHTGDREAGPGRHRTRTEKETDVNLALSLVMDGAQHVYDRSILITGDTDQIPAVKRIADEFMRHVEVWFPPGARRSRWTPEFRDHPRVSLRSVSPDMLARCRLSEHLQDANGRLAPPLNWRAPGPT